MSTGWAIVAAAAAVALAGTVRTWILAFSVPYGHPPQSACPNCQTAVIPPERMGLLGWLPPNGRCRTCTSRIGPAPGTVEAVLAAAAGTLVHTTTTPAATPVLVCLAAAGVTLAFVDLAARRLPDPFTAAAFATAVVVILLQMLTGGGWSQGAARRNSCGNHRRLLLPADPHRQRRPGRRETRTHHRPSARRTQLDSSPDRRTRERADHRCDRLDAASRRTSETRRRHRARTLDAGRSGDRPRHDHLAGVSQYASHPPHTISKALDTKSSRTGYRKRTVAPCGRVGGPDARVG
ncbi:Peptidase A24 N-terminal domain-containing protein [Micromonospora rhizosphaerae]|uniref:Peptidase A24 N-terminal domain-containing protein n=1 Tax=Micromonospora rhizosphaerae TaxID=568872 RepID=A0A1C6S8S9_9ACTN|nr:Peptidase A24 N-terminal domain-containing protein [Micromonospora rhizosphaerae]